MSWQGVLERKQTYCAELTTIYNLIKLIEYFFYFLIFASQSLIHSSCPCSHFHTLVQSFPTQSRRLFFALTPRITQSPCASHSPPLLSWPWPCLGLPFVSVLPFIHLSRRLLEQNANNTLTATAVGEAEPVASPNTVKCSNFLKQCQEANDCASKPASSDCALNCIHKAEDKGVCE